MRSKWLVLLVSIILLTQCKNEDYQSGELKDKIDLLSDNWPGWAISYSGYRNNQDPRKSMFPSQEEVLEDLEILEKNWKIIRTYGADQHLIDILQIIRRDTIGLKVLLGIWLDGEPEYSVDNENQVKLGIQLANKYDDIVIGIIVGNETQYEESDHKVPREKLIQYINKVKSKVSIPVTTADTWGYWSKRERSGEVINAVDFIAAHIYPIWGGYDIDKAMDRTRNVYDSLKTLIPNKKIIITEAGWATYTEGEKHAPKAGDEVKQKKYFNQLMKWSEDNKIIVFTFSAFDESWKGKGTEGHWGLFSEKRKAKLVMEELYPEFKSDTPTSPKYN